METLAKETIKKGLTEFQDLSDSKLVTHLNSCVRCGLCAETCLFYLATHDDRYIPAWKVDLLSSIYRKYFTLPGKLFPRLVNAREMDDATLQEMVDLFYGGCTLCGRCTMHCSVGVDVSFLMRTGRTLLAHLGKVPGTLQSTVDAALETGNNMGIPTQEFIDTLKWMEEELIDEVEDPGAKIPVNETGKDVLYTLNPREPKFFPLSISAMAKIFWAAGESWTLSTQIYDITNYAYFSGNIDEARTIASRLWEETEKLGVKKLVLAECGHGTRVMRWESANYMKRKFPVSMQTSTECIANYIREGRIRLDRDKVKEPVTLHDPCNLVRTGGIIKEQRFILGSFVSDFREMTPHGIDNFCCGGGGGELAMSEYNEQRMKAGEIKAEQIRKTGAKIVVSPCHNCVDQLTQINIRYKLGVQVKTLAEIVADAILK